MRLSTRLNKYFALFFWNILPTTAQKVFSFLWSHFYKTRFSTVLVKLFTTRYKMSNRALMNYAPASGASTYLSFQDFFTRKLVAELKVAHEFIMPCEGVVCEHGPVKTLDHINVKGQFVSVRKIFGDLGPEVSDEHNFLNIFLHNHNYHRFHAPLSGTIKNIISIPGQLNFLRPWLYKSGQASEPALVNERIVMEICDNSNQSWFISFVGGMGVGQIKIHERFKVGNSMVCGEEIGLFLMGSTCCLAIPKKIKSYKYLERVCVGDAL